MRSYDKHRSTKFIQKSDVENSPHGGLLVTIKEIAEENVAPEYKAEEIKYVIYFKEAYKPWTPGIETLEVIKQIAGTGNVDDWSGTKLVLFVDPNVKFGGKMVGGIRCRAPKNQPETQQDKPESTDVTEPDSSIQEPPFCPHCGQLINQGGWR